MKVLVIGDPIIDKFSFGVVNRQSPEDSSISVLDLTIEDTRPGGALNVACSLKRIDNANDVFVAAPMSAWTIETLISNGVGNAIGQIFSDFYSPSNCELIKQRFFNTKLDKQLLRVDNRKKFDDNIVKKFKKSFSSLIVDNFDCLVVSDYNKGVVDWFVVDKIKGLGCPIFVDTKKEDLSMWKDLGDVYVKINWKEFQESKHSEQIKNLIITHGEKPVQLRKYGKLVKQFVVEKVENANVIGAGDIFLSALVSDFVKNTDLNKSIEFAIDITRKSVLKTVNI